jgi:hypothetical protein
MLSDPDMGYQIADEQRGRAAQAPRSLAFVEGMSSHTKVAVPDPIESNHLKIAAIEQPPGVKVAAPERSRGLKVANPSPVSLTGDWRRPIKVSGGDPEARGKVGLKLYATSMDPTFKVRRRP